MVTKVYQHDETAATLRWTDTTGTGALAMTFNALAATTGRQGEILDFGTSARAERFAWRLGVQFNTPPVVGQYIGVFVKTSDGNFPDNDDGTGNIAVSAQDKLRNLTQIGSVVVDEAATGVAMAKGGLISLPHRYFMPVVWNYTATAALVATDNLCVFSLTPVPFEIQ